jgi:hypothetical protein
MVICRNVDWIVLTMIISIISRFLFLTRSIGVVIQSKKLMITEGAGLSIMILFNLLSKKPNNYLGILFCVLFTAVVCFLMMVDDAVSLYPIEDEEDTKE